MKTRRIRVALTFARFKDDDLNCFALLVILCLTNHPLFSQPPVSVAELTALQAAYAAGLTAAARGGEQATAAKKEARAELVLALRRIAAYLQSFGLKSAADLLSSGFDLVNVTNSRTPLATPALPRLAPAGTTRLRVRLRRVPNARVYQVQYRSGPGTWREGGIFHCVREILLTDLTPGTVYEVRVRGVGGSTQYSEWTVPVSAMAI